MTGVKWRRRTLESIAGLLQQHGIHVSPSTVARLLREMDYSLRVNRKMIATSHSPDRSAQFDYLATVRARFERRGLPIISVDTKKRELVGNFKNPGRTWRRTPRAVNDHDFRTDALGIAIPYGIYDVAANHGAVVIGISHNTPCFAVRSIRQWWHRHGRRRYDDAREILILADTGGSNGARCWAWKTELHRQLAEQCSLQVTVAHYPTGASKWNPIEHRLFSEISKQWAGEPLDSYDTILSLIRSTRTKTGLTVAASLDQRHYPTGCTPSTAEIKTLPLSRHDTLPRWNYTIHPSL
jgi:hypothetical protein